MIISYLNKDYIEVDESWLINNPERIEKKIHLVKLCFTSPDEDKIQEILNLLPFTNRFIINNGLHVKIYNDFFKKTVKKFYVENSHEDQWKIISFIRKNNKESPEPVRSSWVICSSKKWGSFEIISEIWFWNSWVPTQSIPYAIKTKV